MQYVPAYKVIDVALRVRCFPRREGSTTRNGLRGQRHPKRFARAAAEFRKAYFMSIDIGEKIKELRIMNGLTQEELADRAELSKGFISQLERNLTSPSISTLEDILQCLGVTVSDFFNDPGNEQIVFGEDDYFEKTDETLGNMIEWIIPNAQKNDMEPIRMTFKAGGSSYPDNPHEGEEFGYVLRGSITIHVGNRRIKAIKGEAFCFTPDKPHHISSESGAEIIWVSTPPSF